MKLEQKSDLKKQITRARSRLLQMHYESRVGHVGGNLSCIDAMITLFHKVKTTQDQFVLSKGHAAGALYVTLWSMGILSDDDLKMFHKDGTKLAGHPPANWIEEISFATGSLGHGLSIAAGLAFAKKMKKAAGRVYCLLSDGECQEGSTWEALIFMAHQKMSNMTVIIDKNGLQGFGSTEDVASMGDLKKKIQGFDVQITELNGHDADAMANAFALHFDKPHFIILDTVKGKGVSFMEGKMDWHYLPMTEAQYALATEELKNL